VDFGLLGRGGTLLGLPRHYRDPHTETAMDFACQTMPRAEIYRRTGTMVLTDKRPLREIAIHVLRVYRQEAAQFAK